jgi:Domain of unknown function (DUF4190)
MPVDGDPLTPNIDPEDRWLAGAAVVAQPLRTAATTTSGTAVASLVFSILSWLLCPFMGALIAIVLGLLAKSEIRRTGQAGAGMATAGVVIGVVHVVVYGLVLVVVLVAAYRFWTGLPAVI